VEGRSPASEGGAGGLFQPFSGRVVSVPTSIGADLQDFRQPVPYSLTAPVMEET
jgi:hypothetical protein